MAVEDGAVLGRLLGLLKTSHHTIESQRRETPHILALFESLRKSRTTLNVNGATSNRLWYHLPDGPMQEKRDAALAAANWKEKEE